MVDRSISDKLFSSAVLLILLVIALTMFFPFYYVFVVSFTSPVEYLRKGLVLFPTEWTLTSYKYLLANNVFVNATAVSTFLATVGTALSLVVTAAGAYTLSRKRLQGRRVLLILILMTTLFNPGIIPPYLVVRELGLINSIWSLIVPVLTSGWYVILMKGFFESIPEELEEAGKIDGASDIGIFLRIILPLSLPSLAAFGLFYAVAYWNTFFSAILYINKADLRPLQVVLQMLLIDSSSSSSGEIANQMSSEISIPTDTLKMAAVVISTVPILLVYPFLQKHFAKGVMVGSIKG
ncbi:MULTISPECIES: carbohydrate ABC transporter permease [Paenibacillus]|jgi:putative aldouronate transport system permease protein|uniref:Carbohydrate ABC transporter permease n=1 Tax=Paenibacillus baimaensis TaxID=2982185 RepID=A0ABT2UBI3_9BACL|nr:MULTISPECIES: carbohydrate ABC transporter permease [unclassified Paenibacillus]MCU6791034.1 carbohydrate ABC transporter permease [Paenibacillus sp. WQ 127069]OMF19196.1 ABC transporter permease [Paenibacillus sp. FSL H7-0331]